MRPPRVVIDTNVHISALLSGRSAERAVLKMRRAGAVRPLASSETLHELAEVLHYPKFGFSAGEITEFYEEYVSCCEMTQPPEGLEIPDCRDASDRPFLELAFAAGADALITGDKGVLALADVSSVPILRAPAFCEWIKARAAD